MEMWSRTLSALPFCREVLLLSFFLLLLLLGKCKCQCMQGGKCGFGRITTCARVLYTWDWNYARDYCARGCSHHHHHHHHWEWEVGMKSENEKWKREVSMRSENEKWDHDPRKHGSIKPVRFAMVAHLLTPWYRLTPYNYSLTCVRHRWIGVWRCLFIRVTSITSICIRTTRFLTRNKSSRSIVIVRTVWLGRLCIRRWRNMIAALGEAADIMLVSHKDLWAVQWGSRARKEERVYRTWIIAA